MSTTTRWHVGIPLNDAEREALEIIAAEDRRSPISVTVSILLKEALTSEACWERLRPRHEP